MHRLNRIAAVLAIAALLAWPAQASAAEHAIDARLSHATFSVQHLLLERVTGSIPIIAGAVDLAPDGLTPLAITATLDARRIDTGDGDRDGDLQGPDWFDTKRFPTWSFRSTRIVAPVDGSLTIAGMLTIHGTSVPMQFAAAVDRSLGVLRYHATVHVDRHAFGMTVTRVDAMIGSDVTIVLDVVVR